MLDLEKFKVYVVGGYVRDRLLGREPKDHDFVVVGATPDDMLAVGFSRVGASFPVFLHPTSGDEYALARTERKVGVGYNGFDVDCDPNTTIEDDLYRRDLTINAMARQVIGWNEHGHAKLSDEIIDPYGGRHDLAQGIIRHVSEAFAEDPVRVLRAARFAARYGFKIATDTVTLMHNVVPELVSVPMERVWAEVEKGLMEPYPWIMFGYLDECGATNLHTLRKYRGSNLPVLRHIEPSTPLDVRFALVAQGFRGVDYEAYKIPTHIARLSDDFNTDYSFLAEYYDATVGERFSTLTAFRAITDETRLLKCMEVMLVYARYVNGDDDAVHATIELMKQDLRNIRSVDAAAIAATCKTGLEIKQKLIDARIAAMSV